MKEQQMTTGQSLIAPFPGWRPVASEVARIAAPPYDVLSRQEAALLAARDPLSFVHVSRAEVDLAPDMPADDPRVYAAARARWQAWCQQGVFRQDPQPVFYLYRLEQAGRAHVGLVAAASVDAYMSGRIRRHELTRPDKEQDRTRMADALSANSGPVFLVYRRDPQVEAVLTSVLESAPVYDFIADDGIRHSFWIVEDARFAAVLIARFDAMERLYIADGHHRSAAAAHVCRQRREALGGRWTGEESFNRFLCVLFADHQVTILEYNRLVRDLNGQTVAQFLDQVGRSFTVHPEPEPVRPVQPHEFGMYLAHQGWFRLRLRDDVVPVVEAGSPVTRLDVQVLEDRLLRPVLGITDPRRDVRIEFVGGGRGVAALEQPVRSGAMAVAFALYPTRLVDLLAVADADAIMPPKSTWFEPKLRDGLVVQEIA
jgi:uncharacterized protein (DUF1015 family)